MRSFAVSLYALALLNVAFSAPTPADDSRGMCKRGADGMKDCFDGPDRFGADDRFDEHKFGDDHGDDHGSDHGDDFDQLAPREYRSHRHGDYKWADEHHPHHKSGGRHFEAHMPHQIAPREYSYEKYGDQSDYYPSEYAYGNDDYPYAYDPAASTNGANAVSGANGVNSANGANGVNGVNGANGRNGANAPFGGVGNIGGLGPIVNPVIAPLDPANQTPNRNAPGNNQNNPVVAPANTNTPPARTNQNAPGLNTNQPIVPANQNTPAGPAPQGNGPNQPQGQQQGRGGN